MEGTDGDRSDGLVTPADGFARLKRQAVADEPTPSDRSARDLRGRTTWLHEVLRSGSLWVVTLAHDGSTVGRSTIQLDGDIVTHLDPAAAGLWDQHLRDVEANFARLRQSLRAVAVSTQALRVVLLAVAPVLLVIGAAGQATGVPTTATLAILTSIWLTADALLPMRTRPARAAWVDRLRASRGYDYVLSLAPTALVWIGSPSVGTAWTLSLATLSIGVTVLLRVARRRLLGVR